MFRGSRRAIACSLGALLAVGVAALPASALVPDAPLQPTVASGNGNLSVSFTEVVASPAVTGYSAVCTPTTGGIKVGTGVGTPITVPATVNGMTYTCDVVASNDDGSSTPSPESAPVVAASAPATPAAPSIATGNAQIQVSVTPPAANGATISSYDATCTSSDGGTPGVGSGASPVSVPADNGNHYTCKATATNAVGTSAQSAASTSILVGVPSTPVQPSAAVGAGQISVGFAAPANNGSAISSYTATCVGVPVRFASGPSSPLLVTGLVDGNTYTCSVTATNGVGTSFSSPDSAPATPAGPPDNPAPPTVTAGNHSIQAAFIPPASNGGPITGYEVTCTSSDGGVTGTLSGSNSPITVLGLTNGKTYSCDVAAFNVSGVGQSDPSVDVIPSGVPDAPAKPTVVRGNARITVSFVLPAGNGSLLTGSNATCTSSNGGVTKSKASVLFDEGDTLSPIVVTGLTNGKSYTCKVTASNDAGPSLPSPASLAVVPVAPPNAPTNIVVQSGLATGSVAPIIVSFNPSAPNGSPVTSYKATCTEVGVGIQHIKSALATTLSVTGNATGHSYSCSVTATSAGGTSAKSAAITVKVGTPGAPFLSKKVQSISGVTFYFAAPSANGKPILTYRILCTSTNGGIQKGALRSSSPILIKSITLGRTYICTLSAQNSRGYGGVTKIGPFVVTH